MKKTVKYTTGNGIKRTGILIKENELTATIRPFRWIAVDAIKIHKTKNHMKIIEGDSPKPSEISKKICEKLSRHFI